MDRKKLGKPFLASFCWSEDKPTTNFVWCIIYIPYAAGIGEWAHLEASLQINVLHWLPAAIKRGPMDGEAYWWIWHRCTMHSRGVRGLTMKKFSHEKRASAESCECSEGSRLFHRVGGFIDHHRARNRVGRRRISEPQHRLLIMYGDDYTIEQKD